MHPRKFILIAVALGALRCDGTSTEEHDGAKVIPDGAVDLGPGDASPPPDMPPDAGPQPVIYDLEVLLEPEKGEVASSSNVRACDLDSNGITDALVSDPVYSQLFWLHDCEPECRLDPIVEDLVAPVRTHAVDLDVDGDNDILVADIGILYPTDDLVGRVLWLQNNGSETFSGRVLLEGMGRTACAEVGDLDGDDDLDIAVCVFGNLAGSVRWLEQGDDLTFASHEIDASPGAIHAFPVDVDGDDDLDIAAVLAQLDEQVVLYRNDGKGAFNKEILFDAEPTYYGMSGLEPVDLDQDGDVDLLFTNGDVFDYDLPPEADPFELHGLQWLENNGDGEFQLADIVRYPGSYSVRANDLDRDGDLDLVLSSMWQVWDAESPPTPAEPDSIIWLENDGNQVFTRHPFAQVPSWVITLDYGDIDDDGDDDLLAGSLGGANPGLSGMTVQYRVALFRNLLY